MSDLRAQLACPRADWPVHQPRVVVLPNWAWDAKRPPHFVLTPWFQPNHVWWMFMRALVPRSRFRDPLTAAVIHVNGGGHDNEYRFLVMDHTSNDRGEVRWGCSNDHRNFPANDPLLATDTGRRIFGSRGVYPAAAGDVPVLMAFCDRLVEQIYPPQAAS